MEASSHPSICSTVSYMDKAISSKTSHLGNMVDLPTSKKERVIVHILATKFQTKPVVDSKLEVGLNPIMRDLVINKCMVKKKRIK
jgi:hypothetical protein